MQQRVKKNFKRDSLWVVAEVIFSAVPIVGELFQLSIAG